MQERMNLKLGKVNGVLTTATLGANKKQIFDVKEVKKGENTWFLSRLIRVEADLCCPVHSVGIEGIQIQQQNILSGKKLSNNIVPLKSVYDSQTKK